MKLNQLAATGLTVATLAMGGAPVAAKMPALTDTVSTATKGTLYTVATAHLDTQWLWTIQTTIRDFLPKTFNENFALMEKFPDYVFSFEGAFRYLLIREYYPKAFERIRELVKAGRWRVCGSSVDAGDVNVPSPESVIRQILYGNGFFRDELGATSCDIFLPDCFGFGFALPSLAAHCGLTGFSTGKLNWGGVLVPFDIGVWEGVDGSRLVASLKPDSYNSKIGADIGRDKKEVARIAGNERAYGVPVAYRYYGTGDTGGAPTTGSVEWIEKSMAADGPVKVLSAGADQMFRDLTPAQVGRLPHYKGELLLTTHGTGCYTAQAPMKRWNRMNERLAAAAERAAVAAHWLGGAQYPRDFLRTAWIRFLWHQFHDDLTGTSIPEAYQFSWNDEVISLNQFASVLEESVGAVARALDTTTSGGAALVVYNPLSVAREDVVEASVRLKGAKSRAVRVVDAASGVEVASQVVSVRQGTVRMLFLAKMPPVGFKVYQVFPAKDKPAAQDAVSADKARLENGRYLVTLDANGDVAGIRDKKAGRELLTAPHQLQLLAQEDPVFWAAWEITHADISRPPAAVIAGPARIRAMEKGPVRAAVEVKRLVRGSTVTQTIRLAAGQAGDRVEFDTRLDWRTPHCLLKAAFPLTVKNTTATYDLGLGTIERGNNTKKLYEVPAQKWADLTDRKGDYGVAVLSDSKYGWDKPATDTLRLTLLHNPKATDKDRNIVHQDWQEFGRHQFQYAVTGHEGGWDEAGVAWQAERFDQPLVAFHAPSHHGALGREFSMLGVSSLKVAVNAVKLAEKGDEVVVRVFNLSPKSVTGARLSVAGGITSAREVTGGEQTKDAATVSDAGLLINLKPYEPKSFALKLRKAKSELAAPGSVPAPLPYDLALTSREGNAGAPDSIPAELFPESVDFRGVRFAMGPKDGMNAVASAGQRLPVPAGKARAYILAAADGADTTGTFLVDRRQHRRRVQAMTGFIGQADSRIVGGKLVMDGSRLSRGFIKRDPVAWVSTHLHDAAGQNQLYTYGCLYSYAIDLPLGAKSLTLPDNPRIRVYAVSFAGETNDRTVAAQRLYD
jgi:alpha-mannosidase